MHGNQRHANNKYQNENQTKSKSVMKQYVQFIRKQRQQKNQVKLNSNIVSQGEALQQQKGNNNAQKYKNEININVQNEKIKARDNTVSKPKIISINKKSMKQYQENKIQKNKMNFNQQSNDIRDFQKFFSRLNLKTESKSNYQIAKRQNLRLIVEKDVVYQQKIDYEETNEQIKRKNIIVEKPGQKKLKVNSNLQSQLNQKLLLERRYMQEKNARIQYQDKYLDENKYRKYYQVQMKNIFNQLSKQCSNIFQTETQFVSSGSFIGFLKDYFKLDSYFRGSQIIINNKKNQFLIRQIEKYKNRQLQSAKLIYRLDNLNPYYFKYIKNTKKNLLLVIQSQQKHVFGAYLQGVSTIQRDQKAFLFSYTYLKCYYPRQYGERKNLKSNYFDHDYIYWTFGANELRFKDNLPYVYSDIGLNSTYYMISNKYDFLGKEQRQGQIYFKNMQIYQLQFKS